MRGSSTPTGSDRLSNQSLARQKPRKEGRRSGALYSGPRIDLRQVDSDRTFGSRADEIRRAVPVFTQLPLNLGLLVLADGTLVQNGSCRR
jgi:hypothetical protein